MESQSGCSTGDTKATQQEMATDLISTGTSQKQPSEEIQGRRIRKVAIFGRKAFKTSIKGMKTLSDSERIT